MMMTVQAKNKEKMNRLRILLLYPKMESNLFKDIKLPPLGLAYIAGALRSADHDIKLIDANLSQNPSTDIRNVVREFMPHVVGISASTPAMQSSLEMLRSIKRMDDRIATIAGGVHPTLFPEEVARESCVDYVVYGEGEETCLELIDALSLNQEPKRVRGIVFKKEGRVWKNPPRPLIKNLDNLPMPAYDLLSMGRYYSPQIKKYPFASMITSRGCPYECIFCDAHVVFGREYRYQSAEKTLSEINELSERHNVKEVIFKDSDFTLHRGRLEAFCEALMEKNLRIHWSCNGRIGMIDKATAQKMRQAGCRLVQFGSESGDQEILDTIKKGITVKQIKNTFSMCREIGLETVANFMIGHPGETEQSLQKTIELAKEIRADYGNFGFATPFPGTELYAMACENKWLLDDFDMLNMDSEKCVMNATTLTTQRLRKMLKRLYKSFYFRPDYVLRRSLTLNPHEWRRNFKGLVGILRL